VLTGHLLWFSIGAVIGLVVWIVVLLATA